MTTPASGDMLAFSLNPAIRNKPPQWEPRFASGWQHHEAPLADLRAAIQAGSAFIAAAMNSDHRSSAAFRHADLAVVDIDSGLSVEQFLAHDLAPYAAYVYTTASHEPEQGKHRFRVLFRLPERVDDPDLYKAIITLLTRALGGDRSCTDCCRLFYGCDHGREPLWNPDTQLPAALLQDAATELEASRRRFDRATSEHSEQDIGRAIHVLEQVIPPTEDGERDRFVKVTAAASSAGEALFAAWSDWASRGHHGTGKNARQTSERFFRGFHGRSSLATLFFLASESDPDWRKQLPDELKSSDRDSFFRATGVAGYDHEDFLGLEELEELAAAANADDETPSLFDPERPWARTAVLSPPSAAQAVAQAANPRQLTADNDIDDEDVDDEFLDDDNPAYQAPPPQDPHAPAVRRGRRDGQRQQNAVLAIRDRLKALYPGLRLNAMSLELEYGPAHAPRLIHDASDAYLRISATSDQPFSKTMVFDMANLLGYENRYHPVKAYLEHCAANAEPCPYFDRIASELIGIPDDPLQSPYFPSGERVADVIMKRFLIGAVARILEPGCTHDWMPILIGSQNCGKSNFFKYLTPPRSLESALDGNPENNDYPWVSTIQHGIAILKERPHMLHASWIVVLDEVERYFRRRYTEELKNLISVAVDRSARKYENERSYPRAFVLCGATNATDFLCDPTGNRRFLPITVIGKVPSADNASIRIVDLDRLKRNRDAIWAAAYRAYLDCPVHTFSSGELAHLDTYINSFQRDSPVESELLRILEINSSGIYQGQSYVTLADVFRWMDVPLDRHTSMQLPITDVMKRYGWTMKRITTMGKTLRVWLRPKE